MAKIQYSYGSGFGEIFLSLRERKIFSVFREEDRAALHAAYGGVQYYWSCSGLSGAGYLQPQEDDLVRLPVYRTDTVRPHGAAETVMGVTLAVPISGRVLGPQGKVVVVLPPQDPYSNQPKRLVFLPPTAEVLMRLFAEGPQCLEGEGWKQFYPGWHQPPRHADEAGWATYRLTHFEPVEEWVPLEGRRWTFEERELRVEYAGEAPGPIHKYIGKFADVRKEWGDVAPGDSGSRIDAVLGIQHIHAKWVRCDRFGLVREWWEENPRHTGSNTTVTHQTGWVTVGSHFGYRRSGERMYCILERRRAELGESFAHPELPELVDYSMEVNPARFYLQGVEVIIAEMEEKLRAKARADLAVWAPSPPPTDDEFVDVAPDA